MHTYHPTKIASQTYVLPVVLHADATTLMEEGAQAGRKNGMESTWLPEYINEAVFELALLASPLVSVGSAETSHFPLRVRITIDDKDALLLEMACQGIHKNLSIEQMLLHAIMNPFAPTDIGFSIDTIEHSATAHEEMEQLAAVAAMIAQETGA